MAEFIGGKGLDLTRAALKKYYSTGHRMYPFFAPNMWDIFKVEDDFDGPIIETNKWTVGNGGGASAASFAVSVGRNSGCCCSQCVCMPFEQSNKISAGSCKEPVGRAQSGKLWYHRRDFRLLWRRELLQCPLLWCRRLEQYL